jgi:hypothetical protein
MSQVCIDLHSHINLICIIVELVACHYCRSAKIDVSANPAANQYPLRPRVGGPSEHGIANGRSSLPNINGHHSNTDTESKNLNNGFK